VGKRWNDPEYVSELLAREGAPERVQFWRSPVFGEKFHNVPAFLLPRLAEMASEVPNSDLGRRIYYERASVLIALAGFAMRTDTASFRFAEPPTDAERRLGLVIGQAFHEGCSLADITLAARIPPDLVIAIGKRTIRRTGWLRRLEDDARNGGLGN
jgi:hypothetical protein